MISFPNMNKSLIRKEIKKMEIMRNWSTRAIEIYKANINMIKIFGIEFRTFQVSVVVAVGDSSVNAKLMQV